MSATVHLDLASLSSLSLASNEVTITLACDNGVSDKKIATIDGRQAFSADFPACGEGTLSLTAFSPNASAASPNLSNDPVVALYGEGKVSLEAETTVQVTITAYVTGELDASLANGVAACDLVLTRIKPASDAIVVTQSLMGIAPQRQRLPIGDYDYTCAKAAGTLSVAAGTRQALVIDSWGGGVVTGPALVSDTLPAQTAEDILVVDAVFSQPVSADAKGAVSVSGTLPLPVVSIGISSDGISWRFVISRLQAGGEYDFTFTQAIHNDAGMPLAATPSQHVSLLAKNHFYVKASLDGGKDTSDGLSPATAFATPSHAVVVATDFPPADVLVAVGNYTDSIALHDNIRLLGGWTTDFQARTISPYSHVSTHGAGVFPVYCPAGLARSAVIDRFWLEQFGDAVTVVDVAGDCTLTNNDIIYSTISSGGGFTSAIQINSGSPLIANNLMFGGVGAATGQYSTGIAVFDATPEIVNNTIDGGTGPYEISGLHLFSATSFPYITNNLIVSRTGAANGVGIRVDNPAGMPLSIQNNVFSNEFNANTLNFVGATHLVGAGDFGLDSIIINGHTVQYSGNRVPALSGVALVTASANHDQPPSDDALAAPDVLLFGKSVGSADCGPYDAPRACMIPDEDYLQVVRGATVHVGAREK